MSKLREAAQAVEDELRNQHKAFANWFLELHATTTLDPEDLAWAAWKAALAQPEAHPPRDEWRLASEVPKDSRPHAYLLKKLAMVMPLFQEARDALTAITEQQRLARGISPSLADRMDAAGTYSVDDWRDVQPPTEVAK